MDEMDVMAGTEKKDKVNGPGSSIAGAKKL